ncbi:MAG: aminotransferase class I/II-fold pyridoxal phosphate-dependent enzyme [Bacilli bacterium]|nr:aminotransferase class I/II-fold pyridoxal phosphate-dependent enzyme [Bacilli bacterium]
MATFKNDYSYLVHPRILNAISLYSQELNTPYGLDEHSKNAAKSIKKAFNSQGNVYFLAGGTQTNVLFISNCLRHYEGVIACNSGHINVHETAAIEGQGYKIILVDGKDGKVYPEDVRHALNTHTDEHMVKPRMVYISNSTEIGTIYSKDELIALHKICKDNDLYLFIDGARLGSALTSKDNDVDPTLLGEVCDAFYVGGTKNGFLIGEALVINNLALAKDFRYHIKNKLAMLAKGYLVGIEFEEAFKDNFYFDLAKQTNDVADYLKEGFKKLNLKAPYSPTNQVFVTLKKEHADDLINRYGCELWEDLGDEKIIRFVTSFMSTKDEVDELLIYLSSLL